MNGNRNLHLNQPTKRYMTGLDGLRAISVLAVIAYHLHFRWAEGGLLGVEIFFVLSGYLITDQILYEWRTRSGFSIVQFWIRRMRRLLPAMIFMLTVVALWLLITDFSRLQALGGHFVSSLFYVNNWYLIFHHVSYFESFGPPSPIGHLWSLSIEEQFYVIWPLVLLIGLCFAPQRGRLMLYILGCAIVSAIAMAIIYEPGTDPSRVYYGTDTRASAILIGAALAVIWPSWRLSDNVSSSSRTMLDMTGLLGIVMLFILIGQTNEFDDSLYRGGFLYLSLITAVVIAVLVHPANRLERLLGCRPLSWIGKRSYSLYIWHYPIIILSGPVVNTEDANYMRIALQVTASFITGGLSYKYIEEPIRRGTFWTNLKSLRRSADGNQLGLVVIVIAIILVLTSWKTNSPDPVPDAPATVSREPVQTEKLQCGCSDDNHSAGNTDHLAEGSGVTAIGDSVILDAAPFLEKQFPGIVIDGKVGRQMSQAKDVLNDLRAQGKLGHKIIIELGTNGVFNRSQLHSLLASLQDSRQIYLITTRVPRGWQNTVNDNLREIAGEFQNVRLIDWYSASENRNDLFYDDGVHLKPEGAQYYASVLIDAIKQDKTY
ncbi:acetyltransferase [Paenibacillus polymyxa]|uniref:acyltransferase family protein n=1 Tax=Paenibacillus polymyxa TaxID=1406 RepID=UPI0010BEA0BE|nr:acyltransferase family protein [Paenibacillus polymyxa]TKH39760.1 acetyltransferase [Paenibacillus polymyxa]